MSGIRLSRLSRLCAGQCIPVYLGAVRAAAVYAAGLDRVFGTCDRCRRRTWPAFLPYPLYVNLQDIITETNLHRKLGKGPVPSPDQPSRVEET